MQLFFSYSHHDTNEVQSTRIRVLDHHRFDGSIWIDTKKMEVGQDLNRMMYEGIEESTHVVCFLSRAYTESESCMFELKLARTLEKGIIPVVLRPETEQFPFGSEELADHIQDSILRIEENDISCIADKIVHAVDCEGAGGLSGRLLRSSSMCSGHHRGSPGECEAEEFVRRQSLNENDLRNIRKVVQHGQGDLVNDMLKEDLSLSGRFALIRMANDVPTTPRGRRLP